MNKITSKKNRKYNYLLTGLIKCECGKPRAGDGQNKHGHFYYRCSERIYKIKKEDRTCFSKGVNAQVLDGALWKELVKILTSPQLIQKYAKKWLMNQRVSKNNLIEIGNINKSISNIIREGERYARAYGSGSLDFEQFKRLMKEVNKKRKSFALLKEKLKENKSAENLDVKLNELVAGAKNVLQAMDFNNKVQVVQDIIDHVIVKERRRVEVWAHIPLQAQITQKLGYEPISRYCGIAECGEVNAL